MNASSESGLCATRIRGILRAGSRCAEGPLRLGAGLVEHRRVLAVLGQVLRPLGVVVGHEALVGLASRRGVSPDVACTGLEEETVKVRARAAEDGVRLGRRARRGVE